MLLVKRICALLLVLCSLFGVQCYPSTGINHNRQPTTKHIPHYTYMQKIKYEVSLFYTKISSNAWWNRITPYNLYLGALPLKNKGHLDKIVGLGVTHLLSMVEDFEIEDGWFNKPVKENDWADLGIFFKQIRVVDCLPLKKEQIDEGIDYLTEILATGNVVYVHCKAGRGRSASIVIAYLMKNQGVSFNEALSFVQRQRPQIKLNKQQRQAILDYFSITWIPITNSIRLI